MSQPNRSLPRRWTPQEDRMLRSQVDLFSRRKTPVDWSAVSAAFAARSNKDCRKRWQKIDTRWNSGAWTESEDEKLCSGVVNYGMCWTAISALAETRSPDQCAKRWRNVLDPNLDHGEWAQHDETRLYDLVQTHGRDWKLIAETAFPNRSRQDLSNRYALLLRKEAYRPAPHPENSSSGSDPLSPHMDDYTPSDLSSQTQYHGLIDGLSNSSLMSAPTSQKLRNGFDLFDGTHDSRWLPSYNVDGGNGWDVDLFGNAGNSFRLDCPPIDDSAGAEAAPFSLPPLILRTEKGSAAFTSHIARADSAAYLPPTDAPAKSQGIPIGSTSGVRSTETENAAVAGQAVAVPRSQPQSSKRRPSKTIITISNLSTNMRTAIVDMVLQEGVGERWQVVHFMIGFN